MLEEVEQYETLFGFRAFIRITSKDVNDALEKIEKGQYGECENCHQKIEIARLKANPAARFCMKCSNQKMA